MLSRTRIHVVINLKRQTLMSLAEKIEYLIINKRLEKQMAE